MPVLFVYIITITRCGTIAEPAERNGLRALSLRQTARVVVLQASRAC